MGSTSARSALCTVAALLAVVVASACASRAGAAVLSTTSSAARWSPLVCKQVADGVALQGLLAVGHYKPPLSNYPGDANLLVVETALSGFRRHGCRPVVVARALVRRLTRRQRAVLLSHLPPATAAYLRRALATV
jgi:hypothetical protein